MLVKNRQIENVLEGGKEKITSLWVTQCSGALTSVTAIMVMTCVKLFSADDRSHSLPHQACCRGGAVLPSSDIASSYSLFHFHGGQLMVQHVHI
jgi:hypothetical protein